MVNSSFGEIKVSIVVACYNQGKYLNDCLESVQNQVYPNWECIIVNDGSKDETVRIANSWVHKDSRYRFIDLEKNVGVSSARNKALKSIKGDYIQFLDADDILEKNKLSNQISFCKEDLIPVSGNRYFYDNEGVEKQRVMGKNGALPEVPITMWDQNDVISLFRIKNPFIVSAPLFPRSVLAQVGFLNENLKAFEDWEFNFRCALKGYKFHHVGYAKKAQVLVRIHSSSMTTNRSEMLSRRRKFNYTIANNEDYKNYFGNKVSLKDQPSFQTVNTVLRSLIPPIIFNLFRSFRSS
ncbi:glycosyltransferase family 2 protein [Algoriphagus kandeliae]|uniref:Glycosyltransferase family 2 protein n=1 Tax=Algoriphagus kandeliae TaxID=2562278 RepID=A0A4Y9QYV6_9BACT|nr:glycosyltransferase family 2 protein [Algoriphagus kandeliae]TFV97230.1 glycosyltransferase family 2 protein [Algoriphagus kandeliae]